MAGLTDALGMQRYALYIMDCGAPVGLRLAIARPERVTALVVQNGNAYTEGLREFWDPIRAYWQSNAAGDREALRNFLKIDATEWQYTHGVPDPSLISPDAWQLDQVYLDRPGNQEIQLDLFYDYRTNVDLYPDFQAFFREHQPPTLIVWGKNDYIFPAEGATPYVRDLPNAELHLVDAGHFILESNGPEVGALIDDFLGRTIGRK
jgi:pimeloyl-ACP methyl ester carboxylesterase